MIYLFFVLAGLFAGGVVAMIQQKRPIWVVLGFAIVAAVFLWLALLAMPQES